MHISVHKIDRYISQFLLYISFNISRTEWPFSVIFNKYTYPSFTFLSNKYFNDQEPWNQKNNQIRLNTIVYTTLEIVRKLSFLLYPIIPNSSLKALNIFDIKESQIKFSTISENEYLKHGQKINMIDILFKKIEKKYLFAVRIRS